MHYSLPLVSPQTDVAEKKRIPFPVYRDGAADWRDGYARAIDQINALAPEMVTIGALRATKVNALKKAAAQNGRPTGLFVYLSEKDPSGFKYRIPCAQQVELFRFARERLDRGRIVPALCKEDVSVWNAVGLNFAGCHCLLAGTSVPEEIISTDRFTQLIQVGHGKNLASRPVGTEPG